MCGVTRAPFNSNRSSCGIQVVAQFFFYAKFEHAQMCSVPIHRLYRCLRGRTYHAGLAARAQQAEGLRKVGVLVPAVASGLFYLVFALVFAVIEASGRTNRRPGLCYPAKDQRELAAECRRLKSMLVPAKRPLPEISSCAHWPTLKPWQSP